MPPVSSKGNKPKNPAREMRTPRSRNTTPIPSSHVQVTVEPTPPSNAYLRTPMATLSNQLGLTVGDILDRGGSSSTIPSVASLGSMRETIQNKFLHHIRTRGEASDRVLRVLSKKRKERLELEQERERERQTKEAEERKHKLKKVSKKREPDEERPLAVGAHGMARQDGVDVHKDNSSTISSPISQAPPSASGMGANDPGSPSGSEASHQPTPAPAIPQFQTFGPDPSTFPDPTVYEIREVTPGMADEERRSEERRVGKECRN